MAKRLSRVERRRRILEAARTVFVREGYSGTRMSDIAAAAKVGKGTLYEYFGSKEDLFSTLVVVSARDSLESLAVPTRPKDPADALRQVIARLVHAALSENLDLYRLFFDFWGVAAAHHREAQKRLLDVDATFRGFVTELVRRGQRASVFRPEVDPGQFVLALGAAIDGMSMRIVLLGEQVDLDAYTVALQDLLVGGLLSPGRLAGASLLKEEEGK